MWSMSLLSWDNFSKEVWMLFALYELNFSMGEGIGLENVTLAKGY